MSTHVSRFEHPEHGHVFVALQTDVTEQREASVVAIAKDSASVRWPNSWATSPP